MEDGIHVDKHKGDTDKQQLLSNFSIIHDSIKKAQEWVGDFDHHEEANEELLKKVDIIVNAGDDSGILGGSGINKGIKELFNKKKYTSDTKTFNKNEIYEFSSKDKDNKKKTINMLYGIGPNNIGGKKINIDLCNELVESLCGIFDKLKEYIKKDKNKVVNIYFPTISTDSYAGGCKKEFIFINAAVIMSFVKQINKDGERIHFFINNDFLSYLRENFLGDNYDIGLNDFSLTLKSLAHAEYDTIKNCLKDEKKKLDKDKENTLNNLLPGGGFIKKIKKKVHEDQKNHSYVIGNGIKIEKEYIDENEDKHNSDEEIFTNLNKFKKKYHIESDNKKKINHHSNKNDKNKKNNIDKIKKKYEEDEEEEDDQIDSKINQLYDNENDDYNNINKKQNIDNEDNKGKHSGLDIKNENNDNNIEVKSDDNENLTQFISNPDNITTILFNNNTNYKQYSNKAIQKKKILNKQGKSFDNENIKDVSSNNMNYVNNSFEKEKWKTEEIVIAIFLIISIVFSIIGFFYIRDKNNKIKQINREREFKFKLNQMNNNTNYTLQDNINYKKI